MSLALTPSSRASAWVHRSASQQHAFHGTAERFTSFRPSARGNYGAGIYFADTFASAAEYAQAPGGRVAEVLLSIRHPWRVSADYEAPTALALDLDHPGLDAVLSLPDGAALLDHARSSSSRLGSELLFDGRLRSHLADLGYDGVIATYPDSSVELVAFEPGQIAILRWIDLDNHRGR